MLNKKQFIKLTSIYCFIYIIFVPTILTRFDIGLTWGPRHFMVILPQLLLLSYFSYASMGILSKNRKLLSLSVLAAVIMQLFSLYALYFVSHESSAFEKIVNQRKEKIVVSDIFFLPEQTPRIFFNKKFYEVKDAKEVAALINELKKNNIRVFVDDSDNSVGYKFNEHEKNGIPVRIEIGPRDLVNDKIVLARRDTGEKIEISTNDDIVEVINKLLDDIQNNMLETEKGSLEIEASYKTLKKIYKGSHLRTAFQAF